MKRIARITGGKYGGSVENRYRFLKEVIEAATSVWPAHRVGVHLSPNGVQAFLRLLPGPYRGWYGALWWDEDPSPIAGGSVDLVWEWEIKLIALPKRVTEWNPRDHLWGGAKDAISANQQSATMDDQVSRLLRYLMALSSWEALHQVGVLSSRFWLRAALPRTFRGPA